VKTGEVVRTRSLRCYFSGETVRGYADFKVDDERKRDKQKVFVLMLLGVEAMTASEATALDCQRQLNTIGYWGEDQLVEVLGKKAAEAAVKKMVKKVREKADG
jgi:hypothetical protein